MEKWVTCPRCKNEFIKRGFEDPVKKETADLIKGRKEVVEWLQEEKAEPDWILDKWQAQLEKWRLRGR